MRENINKFIDYLEKKTNKSTIKIIGPKLVKVFYFDMSTDGKPVLFIEKNKGSIHRAYNRTQKSSTSYGNVMRSSSYQNALEDLELI